MQREVTQMAKELRKNAGMIEGILVNDLLVRSDQRAEELRTRVVLPSPDSPTTMSVKCPPRLPTAQREHAIELKNKERRSAPILCLWFGSVAIPIPNDDMMADQQNSTSAIEDRAGRLEKSVQRQSRVASYRLTIARHQREHQDCRALM